MPSCPNCSYKLVLLSSRPKYKCALCSKLYPEKEIEIREFHELNKRLKLKDIENYEKEKRESQIRISKIKKDLRLLFNGFPKVSKIGNAKPNYLNHLKRKYSKQSQKEYYEKNKDKISQLGKKWRLKHREYDLKRKQEYGKENRIIRNFKAKLRRQDNPEPERERKKAWRNNKLQIMRTYGVIQHYRARQKALALQYLRNDTYSPSSDNPFRSVPTWSLSYLLRLST